MKPGDLDDPTPIEPDDELLSRVHARSGAFRQRRRLQRRVSIGSGALIVVLAVALGVALGGNDRSNPSGPSTATSTTRPGVTVGELSGEWRPVSIAGYSGLLTSPPLSDVPLLRFTNGEVVGNDGCNGFSAAYELRADGGFRPGQIGSEAELCPGAPPLKNAIAEATRLERDDDRLLLQAADGRNLATLVLRAVTARIELPSDTLTAGSTMKGRLIVDNETGHVIPAEGCGSLFQVALSSADYQPMIGWTTCGQELDIPTGVTTYPIAVSASRIGIGIPEPLPPGTYEASLFQSTHVVPDPEPIAIQVTAHAGPAVTTRIELPNDTIVAGTTMKGRVVLDNQTGHPITAIACLSLFTVALSNADYEPAIPWLDCAQPFDIPTGISSQPIAVVAHDLTCTGCAGRPPDLEPGHYEANLYQRDRIVSDPTPIPVEVVAAP